jgi:MarR family 2-MHQ and catechol resistance regulon transcriptional repressor
MPTKYQGSPTEVASLNAFIKFQRAHIQLGARLGGHFSRHGLTPGQFGVMEALWHLGPLKQNELGAKLLSSKPNISAVVSNLERGGLARREPDGDDGRSVQVHLTAKGRKLIEKAFHEFLAFLTEALGVLSASELESLAGLSKKLGLGLARM